MTRISGIMAGIGAAGLVVGLSLSPGVSASFSDEATASAGISVASSLDCDVPGKGIGCPKKEVRIATSADPDTSVAGESVKFTAVVTGVEGSGAPEGCVTFKTDTKVTIGRTCDGEASGNNSATFSVTFAGLSPGTYTITTSYAADKAVPYKNRSSKAYKHTVTVAPESVLNAEPDEEGPAGPPPPEPAPGPVEGGNPQGQPPPDDGGQGQAAPGEVQPPAP